MGVALWRAYMIDKDGNSRPPADEAVRMADDERNKEGEAKEDGQSDHTAEDAEARHLVVGTRDALACGTWWIRDRPERVRTHAMW